MGGTARRRPVTKPAQSFVVVEGNRRLATLKLLADARLRKKLRVSGFPELSPERTKELKSVPTVAYSAREEIVPYLGFRHITGVKKWEPFAKARYVAGLIEAGVQLSEIEDSIGDEARTVKKLYQTFIVLRQIDEDLEMDTRGVRRNLSLLEVALGQQSIKEYLGVPRGLPGSATQRIVPTSGLDQLREVVSWIYGNPVADEFRVITDSRQIPKRLAPVIGNEEARLHLTRTRDLEGAYERSGGERRYYLRQLTAASRAVERAVGITPLYKGDLEIVSQVERLVTLIDALSREAKP